MSQWHVTAGKMVHDENGWFVCDALDATTAEQIVREHNAHDGLVEMVKSYRENRIEMHSMSKGWPELQQGKYQKDIDQIDAVLA